MNRFIKHSLTIVLASVTMLYNTIIVSAVPSIDAVVTENNILSLLDAYDHDGAFLVRYGIDHGSNVTAWWTSEDRLIDGIDIAVHEECHTYTNSVFSKYNYYVGDGKTYSVTKGKLFSSSEMIPEFSEELRSERFYTYIYTNTANMDSDINGIYGLMNEYNAYCNDAITRHRLTDYEYEYDDTISGWHQHLVAYQNNINAFCEFDLYILRYILYARENHPDVYEDIMNNKELIEAYVTVRDRFLSALSGYQEAKNKAAEALSAAGYIIDHDPRGYIIVEVNHSRLETIGGLKIETALTEELLKPEYDDLLDEIYAKVTRNNEHYVMNKDLSITLSKQLSGKIDTLDDEDQPIVTQPPDNENISSQTTIKNNLGSSKTEKPNAGIRNDYITSSVTDKIIPVIAGGVLVILAISAFISKLKEKKKVTANSLHSATPYHSVSTSTKRRPSSTYGRTLRNNYRNK